MEISSSDQIEGRERARAIAAKHFGDDFKITEAYKNGLYVFTITPKEKEVAELGE